MYIPDQWALYVGITSLTISIIAWFGDRRRMRRSNPDAVGFMPWRDLAFCASILSLATLGIAAREWLAS
jgi:hypothetical protein